MDKGIEHSLCFGLYWNGRQAGFARLVADFVQLIGHILGYPPLAMVTRFTLGTADSPERGMELIRDIVSAGK